MTPDFKTNFPDEWLEKVPAQVFGSFIAGELRIVVLPGNGQVDGGVPWNIAVDQVPPHLRMPNTRLWLRLDRQMNVLKVWQRDED